MNQEPRNLKVTILWVIVFGIAMGFLEAAVVVYLRQLYYPEGFMFPLKSMALPIFKIEYLREVSTMIMLCSIAFIAGRKFSTRFAFFMFSFAIWDIFYYIWLKVLINWPESLYTWDILFLIPVVWVGPVLAPVICSLTMILLAETIFYFENKGVIIAINLHEWILLLVGAFLIFCTFVWDYSSLFIEEKGMNQTLQNMIAEYIPTRFNWWLFIPGEILLLFAILLFYKRLLTFSTETK